MNKKERRKALFCALSLKLKNKDLVVLDKIELKEIKTKSVVDIIAKIPFKEKALLAIPVKDKIVEKSSANLPQVKSILVNYLNIKDLLKYKTLILLKDSLDNLNSLVK
jgi:large subunit ribosomal protein L4